MNTFLAVSRLLLRALGVILIVLGLLFWTGNAFALVPIHMLLGVFLVIILWLIAGVALVHGYLRGLAAFAILWGFVVVGLGLLQAQLLPGDFHWIIQVLHLAVGLAAIGMGDRLATALLRAGNQPVS